jgi:hypothetical protein
MRHSRLNLEGNVEWMSPWICLNEIARLVLFSNSCFAGLVWPWNSIWCVGTRSKISVLQKERIRGRLIEVGYSVINIPWQPSSGVNVAPQIWHQEHAYGIWLHRSSQVSLTMATYIIRLASLKSAILERETSVLMWVGPALGGVSVGLK